MNDLSWILYAADVSGSAGKILVLLIIITLIYMAASLLMFVTGSDTEHGGGKDEDAIEWGSTGIKWTVPLALAFFMLVIVLPAKDTIYLIAASEMGEEAIKTEAAQKLMEVINQKLDEQLSGSESDK